MAADCQRARTLHGNQGRQPNCQKWTYFHKKKRGSIFFLQFFHHNQAKTAGIFLIYACFYHILNIQEES